MSFFSILETVFIGPLKLIFEIIFQYALKFVKNPGFAIIFLSLAMNFLVLPLYRRADAVQEEAKDLENKLKKGTEHIKKTFKGNERMMMLQTYNRQNGYKPTDVFKGSISLLLEIPFFMAAYQFLSHLDTLNGIKFGPISDLSKPDGLLVVFGLTLNLLPILMTVINVISSAIYLKGFPLKTKIQLYGIAAFFLVFLYTSPAGLVFYWTLNNVFSLIKNIFYKIKNPQFVLKIVALIVGIVSIASGILYAPARLPLIIIGILLLIPMLIAAYKKFFKTKPLVIKSKPNKQSFILSALFMALFTGAFIPSNFIAASPQEYIDINYFYHPTWYVVCSVCMAVGFFVVWFGVFYWLANDKWKVIFERLMWVFSGCSAVNYLFFGTKLGVISSALKYEGGMHFDISEKIINVFVVLAVTAGLVFVILKWKKVTGTVLLTAIIAVMAMTGINVFKTNASVDSIVTKPEKIKYPIEFSKKGQNVVVIMLDRAISLYVPYIFNEKPELLESFDGFTYYPNTLSYGKHTNFASPALLGGYEYTPVEMNKRDDELLVTKHNEALKIMPTLFSQNGYKVSVCDPPYAGYSWIPDLSIYDDMKGVDAYITKGSFDEDNQKEQLIENRKRNFFLFGVMKSMPVVLQNTVYSKGSYNRAGSSSSQIVNSMSKASGYKKEFMENYNVMTNLTTMTKVTKGAKNNFLFFVNDMTHEPQLLAAPDYTPSYYVDNTQYDMEHKDRFTVNGITLDIANSKQMLHYHANMAAFIQLANWFDYLKENGVYDNTKIILVSDHAYNLYLSDEYTADWVDMNSYNPLLMVKDFNSDGFTVCDDFMTNADVPTLAFDGIIENPVNPFTGKPINSDEKTAHDQYITLSTDYSTSKNNGYTFTPSAWVSVTNNIKDKNDWIIREDEIVLKEHKFPN